MQLMKLIINRNWYQSITIDIYINYLNGIDNQWRIDWGFCDLIGCYWLSIAIDELQYCNCTQLVLILLVLILLVFTFRKTKVFIKRGWKSMRSCKTKVISTTLITVLPVKQGWELKRVARQESYMYLDSQSNLVLRVSKIDDNQ